MEYLDDLLHNHLEAHFLILHLTQFYFLQFSIFLLYFVINLLFLKEYIRKFYLDLISDTVLFDLLPH